MNNSERLKAILGKAAEAVERAGGAEAVMMAAMNSIARSTAQRRLDSNSSRDWRPSEEEPMSTLESAMGDYLAATERGLKRDEQLLREQNLSDAAVSQIMLERRQQAQAEIASILSNTMKANHDTAMDIFRKI